MLSSAGVMGSDGQLRFYLNIGAPQQPEFVDVALHATGDAYYPEEVYVGGINPFSGWFNPSHDSNSCHQQCCRLCPACHDLDGDGDIE